MRGRRGQERSKAIVGTAVILTEEHVMHVRENEYGILEAKNEEFFEHMYVKESLRELPVCVVPYPSWRLLDLTFFMKNNSKERLLFAGEHGLHGVFCTRRVQTRSKNAPFTRTSFSLKRDYREIDSRARENTIQSPRLPNEANNAL